MNILNQQLLLMEKESLLLNHKTIKLMEKIERKTKENIV